MMKIEYQKFRLLLYFPSLNRINTYPTFIIRSVLGKELRRMCCIFKDRHCYECTIKNTCPYSIVFETPITEDNLILVGRNKGSHPFILSLISTDLENTDHIELLLTLMGKGIDYLPYIYYSLKKAGDRGILKQRIPFKLKGPFIEDELILDEENKLNLNFKTKVWELGRSEKPFTNSTVIEFLSPCRLKKDGKYVSHLTFQDLMEALFRRAQILCTLYGECSRIWPIPSFGKRNQIITEQKFTWVDLPYYSARQKKRIKMGGFMGTLSINGEIEVLERSLLEFGELFHIGKNAGFGLGKIRIVNN
jgi:CRISPR-associated endoribonuclease Cas6